MHTLLMINYYLSSYVIVSSFFVPLDIHSAFFTSESLQYPRCNYISHLLNCCVRKDYANCCLEKVKS